MLRHTLTRAIKLPIEFASLRSDSNEVGETFALALQRSFNTIIQIGILAENTFLTKKGNRLPPHREGRAAGGIVCCVGSVQIQIEI